MKQAEERVKGGKLLRDGAQPLMDEDIVEMEPLDDVEHKARNMIIPVVVMTAFMPIALLITGDGNITQGSGSTAVFWSVMLSIVVAASMYRLQKIMGVGDLMDVILKGAGGMISLAILMMLAFSLGNTCKQLGTGQYVATLTSEFLHVGLVPLIVFAASGFVAFSTGTSFGTFALMIPLAVPFVETLGVNLPLVVSAVLGGGVFGDHCSPISDTTLVSSMATASDHIDHVRTQLPYALTAAGIASVFYLIAGFLF
jgi:Na+/H+ antiporter NhaC